MLAVSVMSAAYAAVIYWTGGFEVEVLGRKLRSRAWARPAAVAVAFLLLSTALALRRSTAAASKTWAWLNSSGAAAVLTTIAIGWTLVAGFGFGTFAAGGSDSYCYVSQAHLFAKGELTEEVSRRAEFSWRDADVTLIPLGYRPAAAPGRMAPVCPPGFSLLMAAVFPIGDRAMFVLVPLFGAVILLCTAVIGRQLGQTLSGAAAALLLSVSPTFLLMVFAPMSDVPATALWMAALVVAFSVAESSMASTAAGILAGLAILTRPNLAPLAMIPCAVLLSRKGWKHGMWYGVPVAAAAAIVAWMHTERFGDPLRSGYGESGELFALSHVAANARSYAVRMTALYTPLVWLSAGAPFVLWRRSSRSFILAIVGIIAGTWIAYLLYLPFDAWFFTRFLLPAIPLMLLLSAVVALSFIEHVPLWARTPTAIALVLVMTLVLLEESRRRGVFTSAGDEQKYPRAAAFVRDTLPPSYVLARQHSGSIRLYAGRPTIRWDAIGGDQLDLVVQQLRSIGTEVHVVVDDDEWTPFTTHFAGQAATARLRQLAVFGQTRVYVVE